MADNFRFEIISDDRKHFDAAIEIAFAGAPGGKASAYKETESHGLILSWDKEARNGYTKLPFPLDAKTAKDFIWAWLDTKDRPKDDDEGWFDGTIKKGFRIYNEEWGHVNRDHYSFVGIQPYSMWYGK